MSPRIKAVVFDIGNVLIEWNPERVYDAVIGKDARLRLFDEVDLHAMNHEIDEGAPFHATVAAWASRHDDWHDEILLWHDRWVDMASPRIGGSVEAMEGLLARGVPVYALSNIGVETFALAQVRYPFLGKFTRAFASGHLKCAKPEPEIYAKVEASVDEAPQDLLFTDDRADNIATAAARGWQTHPFDGADGLIGRLRRERLLPTEGGTA